MLTLRIAFRYLVSLRRASTVQRLSVLSFVGVLLGSMAMLIVLSAFNGFEALLQNLYHFQDPDIKIVNSSKRTFELNDEQKNAFAKFRNIAYAFEVLEDKVALNFGDGQMVVSVVGIHPDFVKISRLDSVMIAGKFLLGEDSIPFGLVSIPVQEALNISLNDPFSYLQLAYPKRKKLLNIGSGKIFNKLNLRPSGVVRLEENVVYAPLDAVRLLMDRPVGMNSLQIFVKDYSALNKTENELKTLFPAPFQVLNETAQHADLFKIMQIEKLFVFLAVGFIILISTFNLFVSCSMLVLDKQKDIRILDAIGMKAKNVGTIIWLVGLLVTGFGLFFGLLLGLILCLLQQHFGFVPLGMESTLLKSYPIEIKAFDFVLIGLWVLLSSMLALIKPYQMAVAYASRKLK